MRSSTFVLALALFATPLAASAQTTGNEQEDEFKNLVSLETAEPVRLGPNPAPLKATFTEIVAPETTLDHGPIHIHGYIRRVEQNGRSINQVSWTSVSAVVENTKRVSGISDPLTTQFQYDNQTLPKETPLSASGDRALLKEAIRALFDVGTPEQEPVEEVSEEDSETKQLPQDAKSNEIASAFEVPDRKAEVKEAEPMALPVAYGETSEGCSPRIDWNAGQVVIQTATTKTEGGVTSTTGECSDSASTYAIQRSYARCPSDEIDRETMKAYPTYISYWTDGEGSNHDLTNCIADTDQFFDITTTSDGCTVEVDLENNVARQRAREVYINANNTQIEVSRCSVTGDQSYPITFTTNGCSIRHDYMEGVSAELHRAFYVKDGQEQTALGCAESGRTFAHETLRFLDGIAVCSWLEDPITQAAYPQERTRIDVDGSQEWITECAPIEDAASPFQVTTDGCEFTYFHDIGASVSYGSQKTYYVADEDKRVYLSDCRQSEATYDHHLEGGSVHGWIYNDEARTAKERSAIYIETPWGRREVAPASILPDTPDVPYAYVKTANAQTGESIYEGCEGWYVTALTEQWKRPDNTSYFLPIGPGDPAGPRNVCDVVETNKWIVVGLQYGRVSNSAWTCHGEHSNGDPKGWHKDWLHYVQRYGTRIDRTNFETGEFLGTDYSWGGETNKGYAIAPTCSGAGSYCLQTEDIGRTWFYNGYGWRKIYLSTLPKDW